jgi:Mg2+/Co2+ transporter CorB
MSTTAEHHASGLRSAPQTAFGAVLFVAWGVETVLWLYATIHSVADGEITPLITAVAALALLVLLFGMEGLEVAVIDRWRKLYPERTTSDLAAWLAARQLFVALIVTTATILAHRDAIIIPGSGSEVTSGIVLAIFDLTWTGFTVLWFAQIFPKHLAATNPDRYLGHLRPILFPIVEVVRRIGVSRPGEWVAAAVERRLDWPLEHIEEIPQAPEQSLGSIWRELIPEEAPPPRRERETMSTPAPTGSSGHRA